MTVLTNSNGHPTSGTTAQRTALTNWEPGETFLDTDLGQMLVYNGSSWVMTGGSPTGGPFATNATGTVITNAAAITAGLTLANAADGTKGIKLPVGVAGVTVCDVINNPASNAILKVYPQVNSAINILSANTAISMAANTSCRFVCFAATQWYTIPVVPS